MKNFTKIHPKETIMKSILQLPQNLQFTKKEPHDRYFSMAFEKIFQNTVLCQNTGKGAEKSRTENFHKVHPKETVIKSFFSEVAP